VLTISRVNRVHDGDGGRKGNYDVVPSEIGSNSQSTVGHDVNFGCDSGQVSQEYDDLTADSGTCLEGSPISDRCFAKCSSCILRYWTLVSMLASRCASHLPSASFTVHPARTQPITCALIVALWQVQFRSPTLQGEARTAFNMHDSFVRSQNCLSV
jgi:hypothetical protein